MGSKKAEIRSSFNVSKTKEISVDWGGNNYLVIYGSHINGWFIAIPNWEICTEAAHPSDTFYNMERLAKVLGEVDAAKAIAETMCLFTRIRRICMEHGRTICINMRFKFQAACGKKHSRTMVRKAGEVFYFHVCG